MLLPFWYIPSTPFFRFTHEMTFCRDNCSAKLTNLEKSGKIGENGELFSLHKNTGKGVFLLTSSCVLPLVSRSLQLNGTSFMSTSVTTSSSVMTGTGILGGVWNNGKRKTDKNKYTPESLNPIRHLFKITGTFASNGGGVINFPFAMSMAFIFAAMAAAISTPPWGAGFTPIPVGSGIVLFPPAVPTTLDKETGWAELSLLPCCFTATVCLGGAGLSHRLVRHLRIKEKQSFSTKSLPLLIHKATVNRWHSQQHRSFSLCGKQKR